MREIGARYIEANVAGLDVAMDEADSMGMLRTPQASTMKLVMAIGEAGKGARGYTAGGWVTSFGERGVEVFAFIAATI